MSLVELPPLPNLELLAELCRETAARESVQPFTVEKDFYLTRLLWALAQERGDTLLLKGGTLLSKVDLGFRRMSEDVDLVIPWDGDLRYRATNMGQTNRVRDVLKILTPLVGLRLGSPDGEILEQGAHRIWDVHYESTFGPQVIHVEVLMGPVLQPGRRAALRQLLDDPLAGDYGEAFCWALDADEARAEKVRAACTREAIRDFYDLDQLLTAGWDFEAEAFKALVDRKLAEYPVPALSEQSAPFGMTPARHQHLATQARSELQAVTRISEAPFDLDAMLARFEAFWKPGDQADAKRAD